MTDMTDTDPIELTSDTGRFALIPEWLLRSSVSDRAIRVYAVMAAVWADRGGEGCWPSRATIAATVGCSTDTVDRALADLERVGAVEKTHRAAASGGQTSNAYRLVRVLGGGAANLRRGGPQICGGGGRKSAAQTRIN